MQEKINKQYIDSKINPIIEPMTVSLFNDAQPDSDVVSMPKLPVLIAISL